MNGSYTCCFCGHTKTSPDEALERTQREIDNRLAYVFTWMQPEEVKNLRAALKRRDAAVRLKALKDAKDSLQQGVAFPAARLGVLIDAARRAYEEASNGK